MKRLAIPRSFVLGGKRWQVRFMTPREKRGVHRSDWGFCWAAQRCILLDRHQPREEMERTFIHELVHAMLPDDFPNEEKVANALEAPLRRLILTGALVAKPDEVP